MTAPSERDIDALATEARDALDAWFVFIDPAENLEEFLARAILESDWMAGRDRRVKAEGLREAAAEFSVRDMVPGGVRPFFLLTELAEELEAFDDQD